MDVKVKGEKLRWVADLVTSNARNVHSMRVQIAPSKTLFPESKWEAARYFMVRSFQYGMNGRSVGRSMYSFTEYAINLSPWSWSKLARFFVGSSI